MGVEKMKKIIFNIFLISLIISLIGCAEKNYPSTKQPQQSGGCGVSSPSDKYSSVNEIIKYLEDKQISIEV